MGYSQEMCDQLSRRCPNRPGHTKFMRVVGLKVGKFLSSMLVSALENWLDAFTRVSQIPLKELNLRVLRVF